MQSHGHTFKTRELVCTSCDSIIGKYQNTVDGWELDKWSIGIHWTGDGRVELPPIENLVSAFLLDLAESQGVRKIVLHCGDLEDTKALLVRYKSFTCAKILLFIHQPLTSPKLQIFNTDVRYTALEFSEAPSRAIKIFYKPVSNLSEILENESMSVEEVYLPHNVFAILESTLQERNALLPDSVQTFQEFRVSLLNRFEDVTREGQ